MDSKHMDLYNQLRKVPDTAQKTIPAGRLKGMTDINPMWRIKTLTETFGPCGFGWKYQIVDKRIEMAPITDEAAAFVDILLYVKKDGEWSEGIPGTGGSMFIAKESKGHYVSDECYKMALTDAIGVACKALGLAADVYWEKDKTKYTQNLPPPGNATICAQCGKEVKGIKAGTNTRSPNDILEASRRNFNQDLCYNCLKAALEARDHVQS